jgi:glycosyltransferase involved in cell wall biosynthesis
VIPYGISLPPERASFSNQPFRVVYCGRMVERQKCIQQVMQTLISGCRASSRIEAQLIGDGPDRPACERLVHQAGLADRIRFLGRVPPQRMPSLLQRSQAILLMSDFEGLPLALLEAMASGVVPVVRSIPSGIPELVHDGRTGLIVNNEPEEAAAALVRLAEDPDLWNRCSAASRSLVAQDYSAQQSFCRWNLLIEEHRLAGQFRDPIPPDPPRDTLPFCDPRFQVHYPAHPTVQSRRSLTHVVRRLLRAVRSG